MALVAISSPYGAGGSHVAPALAKRLGVPFLDRPAGTEPEQEERRRRLLSKLGSIGLAGARPAGMELEDLVPGDTRRREIEAELRALQASGGGVVLGRAAAVLLREDPRVLRVLLTGPPERRIEQGMAIQGIDRDDRHAPPRAHGPGAAGVSPDALLRRSARAGALPPGGRLDRDPARDVRRADRGGERRVTRQ